MPGMAPPAARTSAGAKQLMRGMCVLSQSTQRCDLERFYRAMMSSLEVEHARTVLFKLERATSGQRLDNDHL